VRPNGPDGVAAVDSSGGVAPGRRAAPRPGRRRAVGVLTVAALLLAGCSSEEAPRLGFPEPATEDAARVLSLWQGSWLAALIVGGIVWGLIGVSVFRHRRRDRDPELPLQTRYNLPVEILYTLTPLVVVLVLFYFTARDQNEVLELEPNPDNTVHVIGQQWSWTFNYVNEDVNVIGTMAEPPSLVLPVDQTTEFILTSPDVIHSFRIPAFLFTMDVIPGDPNVVQMTPTKLGHFSGKCAELCGTYHSDMLFNVEVVSEGEYEEYIAGLEESGQTGQVYPDLVDEELGSPREEPGEGELP